MSRLVESIQDSCLGLCIVQRLTINLEIKNPWERLTIFRTVILNELVKKVKMVRIVVLSEQRA